MATWGKEKEKAAEFRRKKGETKGGEQSYHRAGVDSGTIEMV